MQTNAVPQLSVCYSFKQTVSWDSA